MMMGALLQKQAKAGRNSTSCQVPRQQGRVHGECPPTRGSKVAKKEGEGKAKAKTKTKPRRRPRQRQHAHFKATGAGQYKGVPSEAKIIMMGCLSAKHSGHIIIKYSYVQLCTVMYTHVRSYVQLCTVMLSYVYFAYIKRSLRRPWS